MIHFEFTYFSFFLTHLELKTINTFVHSRGSLENHTGFQTKTERRKPIWLVQGSTPRDFKSAFDLKKCIHTLVYPVF